MTPEERATWLANDLDDGLGLGLSVNGLLTMAAILRIHFIQAAQLSTAPDAVAPPVDGYYYDPDLPEELALGQAAEARGEKVRWTFFHRASDAPTAQARANAALTERLRVVTEVLRTHGYHSDECACIGSRPAGIKLLGCDCGLTAALRPGAGGEE